MRILLVAGLAATWIVASATPPHAGGAGQADRLLSSAEAAVARRGSAGDHAALAVAFLAKARASGDPSWYARARAAATRGLALDPADLDARRAQASVLVAMHDFAGGRTAAEALLRDAPRDWRTLGLLTDACVELGDYPAAVAAAERMAALRPGLASWTRIAWLRSLHGDRGGALEALELALRAAPAQDPEGRAWTLVHLGHEHLAAGRVEAAAAAYGAALRVLPDHHLALAGLARARAVAGRHAEAAILWRRVLERSPGIEAAAGLGDARAAAGDQAGAERAWTLAEQMGRLARATGVPEDRELARFLVDHDRHLGDALALASAEAATRADVFTADVLGWVLYRNGRLREAKRASARALRLGTGEAAFHYHAGMIAAGLGRGSAARRHLRRALALNPRFDPRLAAEARATLVGLDGPGWTLVAARGAVR